MVGHDRFSSQVSDQVARQALVSEVAATNTEMGLKTNSGEAGSSKSTSLTTREC